LDLISANAHSGTLGVRRGLGNGDFQPVPGNAVGNWPRDLAVADLDGDTDLDLAVANATTAGTVTVLKNDGGGYLQGISIFPSGPAPYDVATADFNGDGKLDLATANSGTYPGYSDSSMSILRGKGNGSFHTAVAYPITGSAVSVIAADLNADGAM